MSCMNALAFIYTHLVRIYFYRTHQFNIILTASVIRYQQFLF